MSTGSETIKADPADTIRDFEAGTDLGDVIYLSALNIADNNSDGDIDINDLTLIEDGGGNVVIDLGINGSITLLDV